MRYLAVGGYVAVIVLANWMLATFGVVTIGGLSAPAAVFAAGLAFTARDLVHEAGGTRWALAAIALGTALSVVLSPSFALASGVAFALAEVADLAVYAPLRRRHWLGAVALSNTVGLVIDSALFLWLAFGSLDFLAGQVVFKLAMTALAVVILGGVRAYHVSLGQRPSFAAG